MKVLIVEDDAALQNYLKDTMEMEGYETRIAGNGSLGFQIYKKFKPDLVISDIQMPEMNGLELLETIRREQTDSIVIIITAYGSEEYAMQALRLGANNYLKKPVRHTDLLPLLRKYRSIIENRTIGREIIGMIIRRELTMKFDNRIDLIPKIVNHLVLETGDIFVEQEHLGISLGLFELLINAVEHGNLEITYEEKKAALESGTLLSLYTKRQSAPALEERKVTVDFRLDHSGCEWMISDEGKGFDWKSVQNPVDQANLLQLHGRGIFITRFQFDELEYSGKGNVVRAKKLVRQ